MPDKSKKVEKPAAKRGRPALARDPRMLPPVARSRKKTQDGLTARQRLFLIYYIGECNFNGAAAMEAAGAPAKSSKTQASQTLAKPYIIEALSKLMDERSAHLKISARTVLMEAFLSYAQCKNMGDMRSARGFLEQVGKHVDVQAFRTQLGLGSPDGGPIEFSGIDTLSTDEKQQLLSLLERAGAVQPDAVDRGATGVDREGSEEG